MDPFRRLGLPLAAALLAFVPRSSEAKVFLTVQEAVAKAFPASERCATRAETKYLTPSQIKLARELSGSEIPSALVVRYAATCAGKPAGHAYTDTHRVRTHPETLFIVVDPQGRVGKVEVLSFDEPLDYIPREDWYGTFKNAPLDPELQIKRKIPFVTGASLTARATLQAARRVTAIDQVLRK